MWSIYSASAANVGNLEFTTQVLEVQDWFLTRLLWGIRGDEDPVHCCWSGHPMSPVSPGGMTVVVSLVEMKKQPRQFTSKGNRNRMHYVGSLGYLPLDIWWLMNKTVLILLPPVFRSPVLNAGFPKSSKILHCWYKKPPALLRATRDCLSAKDWGMVSKSCRESL